MMMYLDYYQNLWNREILGFWILSWEQFDKMAQTGHSDVSGLKTWLCIPVKILKVHAIWEGKTEICNIHLIPVELITPL